MIVNSSYRFITENVDEEEKFRRLVLLCESSLKQEAFRRHVDRVFENYIFSRDTKINMAVKAILYNCMTCESDFSYDFQNKLWIRDTSDRYAFNEAMRKFNKILYHDRRFRGRIPWIVKNVKEYFEMKLVKKYYAATKNHAPQPKPQQTAQKPVQTAPNTTETPTPANTQNAPQTKEEPNSDETKPAEQNVPPADSDSDEQPTDDRQ